MFKPFHRLVPLLVATFVVVPGCVDHVLAQQELAPQDVQIAALIKEIQLGLGEAQDYLAGMKMPLLNSVTLDLVAEATKGSGGTINLVIVSFGKKWEKAFTQEIEIRLTPPAPKKVPEGFALAPPAVHDLLANAIVSAGRGVQEAQSDPKVPLVPSSLKIVLSFGVKGATNAGGKIQILPITLDLGGEVADSATQKITVVFEAPKK